MLVLTRKPGQSIVIAEDIYCTLLGIQGNQVRIGFKAPQHLPIHREEIHERFVMESQKNLDEALIKALRLQLNNRAA